jgi:hypothetical protein
MLQHVSTLMRSSSNNILLDIKVHNCLYIISVKSHLVNKIANGSKIVCKILPEVTEVCIFSTFEDRRK